MSSSTSTTKHPNISFYPKKQKHRVRINIQGSYRSFGYYDTVEEAELIRDLVLLRLGREVLSDQLNDLDESEIDDLYSANTELFEGLDTIIDEPEEPEYTPSRAELYDMIKKLAAHVGANL